MDNFINMFHYGIISGVHVVIVASVSPFLFSIFESGHFLLIKHSRRTINDSTVSALARLRFSATSIPADEKRGSDSELEPSLTQIRLAMVDNTGNRL